MFRQYHGDTFSAKLHAERAMGTKTTIGGPMPPFEKSIQLMAGGDEIFVAAHPDYAVHVSRIIQDLDGMSFEDQPLNLRAGVAFSSAEPARVAGPAFGLNITPEQRKKNQRAHDEGLTASSNAPNVLKPFERRQRRMERLIQKLEDSKTTKKNDLAPAFRKKLDELKLLDMYARAKHGHAKPLPGPVYTRMIRALKDENVQAALAEGVELVDFTGKVRDATNLTDRAAALEADLRKAVGFENFHVDPPPANKIPGPPRWVPKWVLDVIDSIFPKLRDKDPKQSAGAGKVII